VKDTVCAFPDQKADDVFSSPNLREGVGKLLIFSQHCLQDLPKQLSCSRKPSLQGTWLWHHCLHQWVPLASPLLAVIPAGLLSTRKFKTCHADLIQTQPAGSGSGSNIFLQEICELGNPPLTTSALSFRFFSLLLRPEAASIPPSPPMCPRMSRAQKGGAGAPALADAG